MNENNHTRQKSNMEDILFQIEGSSIITNKEISSPVFPNSPNSPEITMKRSESKIQDYTVKDDEELLTFTSFEEKMLELDFEDDTTLRIKSRPNSELTDRHFNKFENLTKRLSNYNEKNRQPEPETYWRWAYESVMWFFKAKTKKLAKHLRISKIIITLNDCPKLGDQGIEFLVDFIKTFENLTYLEFEVKNTRVSDHALGMVCSILGTLKYLTYFYIDFSECTITDEGIFYLANATRSKTNLEELWLRFSWCPNDAISNNSIHTLGKSLETCNNLKVLLLEMNGQTHIGSKGLSSVIGALKEKNIQKLYLYFEKSQVNDNFLQYAGEIIPKLWKLEVFGLNLAHSSFLTVKGVEALEGSLESLKYLKTGLYLYFAGCLGILEKEKMKKSIDELIERKRVKSYVIEFE